MLTPTLGRLLLSGVNGATGEYLRAPLTLGSEPKPRARRRRLRGLIDGVNPAALDETGWGVIFAPDTPPEVEEALSPLLEHRQSQAGDLYRRLRYAAGDDETRAFLGRHGVGPGAVDPRDMPYYLLAVGSPESLPFRFQHQLDVQHAVGRLYFDHPDEYDAYARAVVEAEQAAPAARPTVTLFGPVHPNEEGTPATHADRPRLDMHSGSGPATRTKSPFMARSSVWAGRAAVWSRRNTPLAAPTCPRRRVSRVYYPGEPQ